MKNKDALSKVIMIYWIAILGIAGFFAIESFYDFFRGNEEFSYRIILRSVTLIGILYLLANLFSGLSKRAEHSIPVLLTVARFSYLVGLLGVTTVVMHVSGMVKSNDAFIFGGACGLIAICGYLSSMWFRRSYPVELK
jgi:hypothetical protein